jgi:phosphoglycolate phosphatase-like HAD superfamily hydrolase
MSQSSLEEDPSGSLIVVFDLDGTLFDSTPRSHLVPQGVSYSSGWYEFHRSHQLDNPVPGTILLAKLLKISGFQINVLSYRPDEFRQTTVDQLVSNDVPFDVLRMWTPGDPQDIGEFKASVIDSWRQGSNEVALVVEDSVLTASTLRDINVTTLLVPHPFSYRDTFPLGGGSSFE